MFCFIWTVMSAVGSLNAVNIQWIPAHVDLEGNLASDQEALKVYTDKPSVWEQTNAGKKCYISAVLLFCFVQYLCVCHL